MTNRMKIAVSLPADLVERARHAVAQGRSASVSSYVTEALEQKTTTEDLASMIDEMLDESGGALSAEEATTADRALGR